MPDQTVAQNRPRFSAEQSQKLVARLWNLTGSVEPLPSERDRNFLLHAESGDRYVIKLAQAAEDRTLLDVQNEMLARLAPLDIGVPRIVPSTGNQAIEVVTDDDGRSHLARVLTWVAGQPMATVSPHTPGLLHHLGVTLGTMDNALQDFDPPAAHRVFQWDLCQGLEVVRTNADCIVDTDQRSLVQFLAARVEQRLAPRLNELRRSLIQNDANDHNVLVESVGLSGDDPMRGSQRVAGIIDFGDVVHSLLAAEPAVAAAYAMLGKTNPLSAAASIAAGYHSVHPLTEPELSVIFDLACLRLCMSVSISAEQARAEPDNPYLSVTEAPAWELLTRLARVAPHFAESVCREACGLPPCPKSARVTGWLQQQTEAPAAVVEGDLSRDNLRVLDLSFSATDPGQLAWTETSDGPADGRIEVGRYDEPRLCYTADQFACEETAGQQRTVHLGIDLMVPPETRVFAPLAGTVYSLADNDQPLDYGPTVILRHETQDGTEFFTLYGHLSRESLSMVAVGAAVSPGDTIGTIGDRHVNGGWVPHLHFQIMTHMLDYDGDFPGVAPPDEREVWLSLCPDPNLLLQLDADPLPSPWPVTGALRASRTALLGPSLSLSYRDPLTIVRGQGQFLYDPAGRGYLDTVNNVAHVGHCHPRVVTAGQRQMAVLNTNTRYLHENIARYAEQLTAKFPAPLDVCFFVCSGSEANELALRLARTHTGGTDFIVLDSGYHGNTSTLVDLSPYKCDGPGGHGVPDHVRKVRTPDPYRGRLTEANSHSGEMWAEDVRVAAEAIHREGRQPAAFLAEAIASCGGQIVPPPGYLSIAAKHARDAGALYIADEVQTGFGRVGSRFWAFELQDVVPDIVTLGKPIGNGHPLAAVVTTREIAESFANGMEYFNTFGGNPVSCAIGAAVLDVIEQEELQARAERTGKLFLDRLGELSDQHTLIGEVRGHGLFLGIEFVRDQDTLEPAAAEAGYIVERLKDERILASTDGPLHNVIKIKPPLVFNENDAARYCRALEQILKETPLQR